MIYEIIIFLASIVFFIMFSYWILIKNPRSSFNRLYALFVLSMSFSALNKMMIMYNPGLEVPAFFDFLKIVNFISSAIFLHFLIKIAGEGIFISQRKIYLLYSIIIGGGIFIKIRNFFFPSRQFLNLEDKLQIAFILGSIIILGYYLLKSRSTNIKKKLIFISAIILIPGICWFVGNFYEINSFVYLGVILQAIVIAFAVKRNEMESNKMQSYDNEILYFLPDPFFIISLEGKITSINLAALKLLNYQSRELLRKPYAKIFENPEQIVDIINEEIINSKEATEISNLELLLKTKKQESIPVLFSAAVIKDSLQEKIGIVCSVKKITKLIEAQERLNQYFKKIKQKNSTLEKTKKAMLNLLEDIQEEKRKTTEEKDKVSAILENIADGVFVVDRQFRIILFNRRAQAISGFKEEEVRGVEYQKVLEFVKEKEEEIPDIVREAFHKGEIVKGPRNLLVKTKQKKRVPVSYSASPIKNHKGKVIGCVSIFRDVTEERMIDRTKTEFVSLASHQLKTPLSIINWYLELLISEDAGRLNKEQNKYLKEVEQSSQRMVALVNSLLNVSRIEMGTLAVDPEPVDLKEIILDVIKQLEIKIKEKKHKVTTKFDDKIDKIKLDKQLIQIVLMNLVSNAIKYTPEKGRIRIATEAKADEVLIKVKDNGYGIPKNQKQKIFHKLFRANNVKKKETDGTGLGLYIVKSIVEESGGKIWFESKVNQGTTFIISIAKSGMKKKKGQKELSL
ncbi:MAG: PAS domain S-box protein [Candidatus Moranbacteria bacterium]|nr:PAS domain S-box protein [Candidatus Moranbacteria bacterium]